MKCTICKQYISYKHYYVGASLICQTHLTMFDNMLDIIEDKICKKCFQKASQNHIQDYDMSIDIV